jgi:hypothetical protein
MNAIYEIDNTGNDGRGKQPLWLTWFEHGDA